MKHRWLPCLVVPLCISACSPAHNDRLNGVWEQYDDEYIVINGSGVTSYVANRNPNGETCYSKGLVNLKPLGDDRYEVVHAGIRDTSIITRSGDVITIVEMEDGGTDNTERYDKSSRSEADIGPLCASS